MESNISFSPNYFESSPNKDRNLQNIVLDQDPIITESILPKKEGDKDITHKMVAGSSVLMSPWTVKDFKKDSFSQKVNKNHI